MVNETVIKWSTATRIGSEILASRFEQVIGELQVFDNYRQAIGSLQVLAAQAVRELDIAEERSLDPADALAREDAAL